MRSRFTPHMVAIAAAGLLFAGPASAADLLTDPAPDFTPPPIAAFDWSGAYVGAHFGYVTGEYGTNIGLTTDGDGFIGGGTLGINWQFNQFVIGAEGDLGYLGADGDDLLPAVGVESDFYGTLRGRAGFAIDRLLVYGTAGVAFLNVDITQAGFGSDDATHFGWTAGGGAEYAVTDALSIKGEYLYLDFDNETYFGGTAGALNADYDAHVIRGGINYRFHSIFGG